MNTITTQEVLARIPQRNLSIMDTLGTENSLLYRGFHYSEVILHVQ